MKRLVYIAVLLALSGCAVHKTTQKTEEVMETTSSDVVSENTKHEEDKIQNITTTATATEDVQELQTVEELMEVVTYVDSLGQSHTVTKRVTTTRSTGERNYNSSSGTMVKETLSDSTSVEKEEITSQHKSVNTKSVISKVESGGVWAKRISFILVVFLILILVWLKCKK